MHRESDLGPNDRRIRGLQLGAGKYWLAVAEQQSIEVHVEQSAYAIAKSYRIIHNLLSQQPTASRRLTDHRISDKQNTALRPM